MNFLVEYYQVRKRNPSDLNAAQQDRKARTSCRQSRAAVSVADLVESDGQDASKCGGIVTPLSLAAFS